MIQTLLRAIGIRVQREKAVRVGDRFRFSTELLDNLKSMPDGQSNIVYCTDIVTEDDGCKNIKLRN